MREGWKSYKLGELTHKITKGTTPTTLGHSFVESGVTFIKAESILIDGSVDISKFMYIDENTHEKLKRSQLEEDDILFSMAGMVLGKTAIVKEEFLPANTNQALAIIRLKKEIAYPQFVNYFMRQQSFFNYVNQSTGQSAQPNINLEEIGNLEIDLPSLPVQRRIATILSALDEKIELNRQTNQTLEAVAQALFKEWFVDFNFPGATGEMQESKLGPIPVGWKVGKLWEVCELNPRLNLKKGTITKYIEMKDLSQNSLSIEEPREREFTSGSKFQNGDTLLARITPCLENGKTGFVDFLNEQEVGWGSTEFIVLRGKETVGSYFIYCLSRLPSFREFAIQSMVGSSGRQRVVESILSEYQLVIPNRETINIFSKKAKELFNLVKTNSEQAKDLAQTRDTLLPKLMSGEIAV